MVVDKLRARLNVLVCFGKDVLQLECDRKRANYQMKHRDDLMTALFPNTSRVCFYWQQDREAIICTLTGDLNSED